MAYLSEEDAFVAEAERFLNDEESSSSSSSSTTSTSSNNHTHTPIRYNYTSQVVTSSTVNYKVVTDDFYAADVGFDGYVPVTTSWAPWPLVGVVAYSIVLWGLFPWWVALAQCLRKRKQKRQRRQQKQQQEQSTRPKESPGSRQVTPTSSSSSSSSTRSADQETGEDPSRQTSAETAMAYVALEDENPKTAQSPTMHRHSIGNLFWGTLPEETTQITSLAQEAVRMVLSPTTRTEPGIDLEQAATDELTEQDTAENDDDELSFRAQQQLMYHQHSHHHESIPNSFRRVPEMTVLETHHEPAEAETHQQPTVMTPPSQTDHNASSNSRLSRFMQQMNADLALSTPHMELDETSDEDNDEPMPADEPDEEPPPIGHNDSATTIGTTFDSHEQRPSLNIMANPKYAISFRGRSKQVGMRRRSWYGYFCSRGFFHKIYKCAYYDDEMRTILQLAIPFTMTSVIRDGLEFLEVVVISRNLGTTSLAVYYVVQFVLKLSTMVLDGALSSLYVLCSHAVGAQNYTLAGRYAQLSVVVYQVLYIPIMVLYWTHGSMEWVISWLGLSERDATAVDIANQFAPYAMLYVSVAVFDTTLHSLLDIIGLERYSTLLKGIHSIVSFFGVTYISLFEDAELWMIGVWHVGLCALFFTVNMLIVIYNQWLNDYWRGMLWTCSLTDTRAVKTFLVSSLSLSVRYMVEYCGWEILFVFAAMQGPAEIAVWGLLGSAWDVVDDIANAVAGAAKVRVAQLLGSNAAAAARYSAHKTFFLSIILSSVWSFWTYLFRHQFPGWLTQDIALKKMLYGLLPLVCVGLLVLPFGTMAWAILCAQGRSTIATAICFLGTLGVTLPLAAFFTVYNVNLEGLLTAVIAGYATAGALNSFVMVISDWEKIAAAVYKRTQYQKQQMQAEEAALQAKLSGGRDDKLDCIVEVTGVPT